MRAELLYISPVVPALTGNGLAMRAGMVLEALASRCNVSLLVMPFYAGSAAPPVELSSLCKQVEIVPRARPGWLSRWRAIGTRGALKPYAGRRFDVVHVFRLTALPYAGAFLSARPKLHLDIDDIESSTHQRLAALHRLNDDAMGAAIEDRAARTAEAQENAALAKVDRVYVCSQADKERLEARAAAQVCVLPNAVRMPAPVESADDRQGFRLLFVGSLGYYPNEDAALYLCREVVPRLRQKCGPAFDVDLVGGGSTDKLRRAAADAGVHLWGAVPAVGSWYRKAAAVVTPIRAGGGTRIKILEAFSHRRPVVSTTLGAEGLDVRDGQEILLADTPDAFADACLRLMRDGDLVERLAQNAFDLVQRSYSAAVLGRILIT